MDSFLSEDSFYEDSKKKMNNSEKLENKILLECEIRKRNKKNIFKKRFFRMTKRGFMYSKVK